MRFSVIRQHKKINANCEKLFEDYQEMLHQGNEHRATTLRRRICNRYGKDAFDIMMGVDPDDDNTSENP